MIASFSDASFKGVNDILEWGQLKLEGNVTSQAPTQRKSLNDIENEFNTEHISGKADPNPHETETEDDDKV